jgi:hypothetical protein
MNKQEIIKEILKLCSIRAIQLYADMRISYLTQKMADKNKEIEWLRKEIDAYKKTLIDNRKEEYNKI